MWLDHLDTWAGRLARGVAVAGLLGLLAFALMTIADVSRRWLLNAPIAAVGDLGGVIITVAVGACFPAVLAGRENIAVRMGTWWFGDRVGALLDALAGCLVLALLVILARETNALAADYRANNEQTWIIAVPVAPFWQLYAMFLWLCVPIQLLVICRDLLVAAGCRAPERKTPGDAQ